jgi:hypothetical protein
MLLPNDERFKAAAFAADVADVATSVVVAAAFGSLSHPGHDVSLIIIVLLLEFRWRKSRIGFLDIVTYCWRIQNFRPAATVSSWMRHELGYSA